MNYFKIIDEVFSEYKGPKFSIELWDGKKRWYGKKIAAHFGLIIKDPITVKKIIAQGSIGFGESFMDGTFDVEGDIEEYLRLRHQFKKVKFSLRLAIAKIISSYNIPKDRKNQIAYHYDLGNDFFSLLLDKKTMSYSAGLFKQKKDTLDQSQQNKLDLLARWIPLPANASILDIGSGWGGFAINAAKKYKWKITGITLSKKQLQFCNQLISKQQLKKLISFNYQDLFSIDTSKKYDAVIMIEALEHVGKKNLDSFFKNIHTITKPNGLFILQFTGRYKPKRVDRWTLKYVFPGGYLPTKDEVITAAQNAGFKVEEVNDDTTDYIKTMTIWIKNLKTNKNKIINKFDLRFYRLWYLWTHGAKVNFELNEMSLFRMRLKK